jgi:hypothetical protein
MTTLKELLAQPARSNGDDPHQLICFIQQGDTWEPDPTPATQCTFDELPDLLLDTGYGSFDGPALIAYSPRFVYVYAQYDGSQWIEAVPRNPENVSNSIPVLGGG